MTAGVKIYNGNRQVLVDDTYQNLALRSVIALGSDKGAWSWDSSTVDFFYQFLNHLCDGEHAQYTVKLDVNFLNHLCDGEPCMSAALSKSFFLNHLCDGELYQLDATRLGGFLNHLCDGERQNKT